MLLKDSASFDIEKSLKTGMLVLIGCQSMSSLMLAEHLLTLTEEGTLHMLNGLISW